MNALMQIAQLLGTDQQALVSLMKERIDHGRALEAVLTGTPIPERDPADDDRITQDDLVWCLEKLRFLVQPSNRNEYVRILDRRAPDG